MSSALQRSGSSALRDRSALGLLIVALLLAQIFLFGSNACPVRPGEFATGSGQPPPDDLQLLSTPGATPATR